MSLQDENRLDINSYQANISGEENNVVESPESLLTELLELERNKLSELSIEQLKEKIKQHKTNCNSNSKNIINNGELSSRSKDSTNYQLSDVSIKKANATKSIVKSIKTRRKSLSEYNNNILLDNIKNTKPSLSIKKLFNDSIYTSNDIQPLAHIPSFDEVHDNGVLQQFLFTPKSSNSGGFGKSQKVPLSRSRRDNDGSSTYSPSIVSGSARSPLNHEQLLQSQLHPTVLIPPVPSFDARSVSVSSTIDLPTLDPVKASLPGEVDTARSFYIPTSRSILSTSDSHQHNHHNSHATFDLSRVQFAAQLLETERSFQYECVDQPLVESPINQHHLAGTGTGTDALTTTTHFTPQIPGSFEFCIIEADLRVLKSVLQPSSTNQHRDLDITSTLPIHKYCIHDSVYYNKHISMKYQLLSSQLPSQVVCCYPSSLKYNPSIGQNYVKYDNMCIICVLYHFI